MLDRRRAANASSGSDTGTVVMDRKSLPRGRVRKPYAAVRHWRIVAAPHLYQTVVPSAVTLLGFTFYWGLSRKKTWVVKQKTSKPVSARRFAGYPSSSS